jgi:hypothetical protein
MNESRVRSLQTKIIIRKKFELHLFFDDFLKPFKVLHELY